MKKAEKDFEKYTFEFAKTTFEVIFDVGSNPPQLLVGTINKNWATVIDIDVENDFWAEMNPDDFFALRNVLFLNYVDGSFRSVNFLYRIGENAPKTQSNRRVKPSELIQYRASKIKKSDEPEKTVFKGWNDHILDGKTARNFDKTEKFLGKRVADFCRENNISSIWTTPDLEKEPDVIKYPWEK